MVYEDTATHYHDFEYFYILVYPTQLDITVGNLQASVSENGVIGYYETGLDFIGMGVDLNRIPEF